jgi:molybdopterin-containing oxidoreductase family membrane subunit
MNSSFKKIAWVVWLILALLGVAGVFERIVHGHASANYGSYVVWGLWVSSYIYFVGLSAGAFLLSSLIYVAGIKKLERLGKISLFVAIITLFMALFSIWMDLGSMWRFYRVFTNPNFSSIMAWMIWLYTTYFIILLAEFWLVMRSDFARWSKIEGFQGWLGRTVSLSKEPLTPAQEENAHRWLKMLGTFGVPLAIMFHGGVGALFGTVSARTYWHTPLVPVLFLTGALVSGGALMTFVFGAFWQNRNEEHRETIKFLGRIVLGLLLFDLMLEFAEFSIPMWYGIGSEYLLMKEILFGHYWWVFWVLHIFIGAAIPIYLILKKGEQVWANATAGLLVAVTFLAVRLNIVIPGLIEPNLKLLETSFSDRRLKFTYLPSLFEWQVLFFIIAVGIAIFYIGYNYLPLTQDRSRTS